MSTETARAIEAILMVAQEPVEPHLLAQLLEVAPAVVEETVAALQAGYTEQGRGFELVKVAGGYRFQSSADLAAYVERFALEGQSARLSNAALETLAIVAYKQPLSRAQVAAIRGVNVDGVMRTLQQRGYVEEVGRDPGPGQATLFGTSREFLERMGLDSLEDLPPIAELFPAAEVLEALEKTLRAERPPVDEPASLPLAADGEPTEGEQAVTEHPMAQHVEAADLSVDASRDADAAGPSPDPAGPAGPAAPVVLGLEDDIDDRPAPEPPSWALTPPATAEGEPADAHDVDVDVDGTTDLPAEP